MLKLPQVTLCTIGDKIFAESNQRALDYSTKEIEFGAVKNIIHPCGSIESWNYAVVFELGKYINTKYALLVHPDGYVVHPESWKNEFLDYDFIGAPWPSPQDDYSYRTPDREIMRVGNSVSIRSKKLLDLPKTLNLRWKSYHGNTNEDGFITCHNRRILQHRGCRFAPLEVAKWFSRELDIPENVDVDKPFAFHRTLGRNAMYENFE